MIRREPAERRVWLADIYAAIVALLSVTQGGGRYG
jgi:hypothetical protein